MLVCVGGIVIRSGGGMYECKTLRAIQDLLVLRLQQGQQVVPVHMPATAHPNPLAAIDEAERQVTLLPSSLSWRNLVLPLPIIVEQPTHQQGD